MKYYRVRAEVVLYVAASTTPSESACVQCARECISDTGFDAVSIREVTKRSEIPKHWQNAIPYGESVDDKTLRELLPRTKLPTKIKTT